MRSNPELAVLMLGFVLIVLGLFGVIFFLYLAYFRVEEIFDRLKKSPGAISKKGCLEGGPIGRFYLITCIGALMMFPKKSLTSGELNLQDYQLFPMRLRRMIELYSWSMYSIGLASIGLLLVRKFMSL